jgi:hypothetical protein
VAQAGRTGPELTRDYNRSGIYNDLATSVRIVNWAYTCLDVVSVQGGHLLIEHDKLSLPQRDQSAWLRQALLANFFIHRCKFLR